MAPAQSDASTSLNPLNSVSQTTSIPATEVGLSNIKATIAPLAPSILIHDNRPNTDEAYQMIIRKALVKNLHGHLNASLSFKPGVNILIGVNGSGKTSILNAMAWTLSPASVQGGLPAAYLLASLIFDEISIAFTLPGQRKFKWVHATRSDHEITIAVDEIDEVLTLPVLSKPTFPHFRRKSTIEGPDDLAVRLIDDKRNSPVLRYLDELPGPLYLPLDRRWTEEREPLHRISSRRSTTAGHLPISEVAILAERAHRHEQHQVNMLTQTFRNDFLTSLLELPEFTTKSRVWTVEELANRRERVEKALVHLGLTDVGGLAENYFSRLEAVVMEVGGQTMPEDWTEDPNSDVWLDWILQVSGLAFRVEQLIPLIEKYDLKRLLTTRRSAAFLDSVNNFLRDNQKKLDFSSRLELSVELANGQRIAAQDLSSGELQLLILFTFLYFFFEDPDQEFAVLVDEPELSLHVAWQNRYINSVTEANPKAQFLIATHSPEIAGQFQDSIIDITPERQA